MSHPWCNGFPITHQIGWICAVAVAMDKGYKGQSAQLSHGHSVCELYQRVEDGPFCDQTKKALDEALAQIKYEEEKHAKHNGSHGSQHADGRGGNGGIPE